MSEFKFACPVCGQHITADSNISGGQIECPTCFQRIIVPQAPASPDTKLILSAAQVGKARPIPREFDTGFIRRRKSRVRPWASVTAWLLFLGAAGAAVYVYREQLFPPSYAPKPFRPSRQARPDHPVPANIQWTLNLSKAPFPLNQASGRIHGRGFVCEQATLQGGTLTLRQGKNWPPDLSVSVVLFARQSDDLSGKSVEVTPERSPPMPRVVVRWRDEEAQPVIQHVNSGYALKVVFEQAANGRMPGRIYLCLPDELKSFVAGTFDAEILKPAALAPPR